MMSWLHGGCSYTILIRMGACSLHLESLAFLRISSCHPRQWIAFGSKELGAEKSTAGKKFAELASLLTVPVRLLQNDSKEPRESILIETTWMLLDIFADPDEDMLYFIAEKSWRQVRNHWAGTF